MDDGDPGLRRRRQRERQACAREGLWDGGPRARRAEPAGHDFRGRIGLQAVHGRRGAPACARRQAVARRSGPQVHPGAAGLRHADHDPADAAAHERPARLGQRGRHRGLAARHARLHPCACPRHPGPSEAPEFHAGHALVVQQFRLQPRRDPRLARQRRVVRRVLAQADLRAARHDPHLVAGRLLAHREGPRRRLCGIGRPLLRRHAVREYPRQWRDC